MKRSAIIVLWLALFCTGCRPDVLVDIVSRIYPDGSIDRQVDVSGREKPTEEPPDSPGWLRDKSGLILANPGLWDRVEAGPASIHAEGIFRSAEDIPPILAHLNGPDRVPDRQQVGLEREDLVILTRWRYLESLGDPYGPADVDAALNAIVELVGAYFREELTAMYADRIDLEGVDRFLHAQVLPIAREFLGARQASPGLERFQARYDRWRGVLSRYGAPVIHPGELEPGELPPDFWELQTGPLLNWSRNELAAAITTADETVEPHHLQFIPAAEQLEERLLELLIRLYGSEEDGLRELEPLFQAIEGHYASGGSSRYRFRFRITLPGTVLATNGATENDSLVWFFRGAELAGGDMVMQADSVELNLRALKALSARRDFQLLDLLNLVDILGDRDPEGALKERLRQAIDAGDLALLASEEDQLPPELQSLALELVELLSGG